MGKVEGSGVVKVPELPVHSQLVVKIDMNNLFLKVSFNRNVMLLMQSYSCKALILWICLSLF